jgi:hypothetical protein
MAHRSSSGALNCICSLWFKYPCGVLAAGLIRPFTIMFYRYLGFRNMLCREEIQLSGKSYDWW